MPIETEEITTRQGDLALLVSKQNKRYLMRLEPGKQLQTHRGVLSHEDLIGLPWGSEVFSHLGSSYLLVQPSLADLLLQIRRNTQIMYPKDIGLTMMMLGIGPGQSVIEAGTGSGAFTTALAHYVGMDGRVYTYEARPEMHKLAQKNLEQFNLADRVTFKLKDIVAGFDETNVDALFLDLPNPNEYLAQAHQALKPGGHFGSILPTANQVSRLLTALHRENFAFVEVCEVLLRFFKPVPDRLRPTDRMVAHTGYLIFARSVRAASFLAVGEEDELLSDAEQAQAG